MDWLKDLLEEKKVENVDEVVESFKKEFPKHAIPKDEFNKKSEKVEELQSELEVAQSKLEEMNSKVSDLSTKAENAEELDERLNEIKSEYENYKEEEEKRIANIKKRNALEKKLLSDNVPEDLVDLVANDFDTDTLELDDGNLLNYESQRKKAKKKRPSAFGREEVKGNEPVDGDEGEVSDNPFKKGSINLMEQGKLISNKPDTARRLIEAAGKDPAKYKL